MDSAKTSCMSQESCQWLLHIFLDLQAKKDVILVIFIINILGGWKPLKKGTHSFFPQHYNTWIHPLFKVGSSQMKQRGKNMEPPLLWFLEILRKWMFYIWKEIKLASNNSNSELLLPIINRHWKIRKQSIQCFSDFKLRMYQLTTSQGAWSSSQNHQMKLVTVCR